jgi:hypothetical protein
VIANTKKLKTKTTKSFQQITGGGSSIPKLKARTFEISF